MCGSIAFTSCVRDDNPVPETETDDPQRNPEREQLLLHIKDDAKQMADNLEFNDLDVTSQAFSRLSELMVKDRSFIKNMQALLSASIINTGLPKMKPVERGSELLKMGYYIGIGGVVTFKNSRKLIEVVDEVPLERMLLETDCPYQAPTPHRGERNYSGYLSLVADRIAEIKQMPFETVVEETWHNAHRLYKLSEI